MVNLDMVGRPRDRKLYVDGADTAKGLRELLPRLVSDRPALPVKLAFSLRRDRSGQIVFDVPAEGNLNDPNFRMGRVVGRAFVNVIAKLATSPFKLLGGET